MGIEGFLDLVKDQGYGNTSFSSKMNVHKKIHLYKHEYPENALISKFRGCAKVRVRNEVSLAMGGAGERKLIKIVTT